MLDGKNITINGNGHTIVGRRSISRRYSSSPELSSSTIYKYLVSTSRSAVTAGTPISQQVGGSTGSGWRRRGGIGRRALRRVGRNRDRVGFIQFVGNRAIGGHGGGLIGNGATYAGGGGGGGMFGDGQSAPGRANGGTGGLGLYGRDTYGAGGDGGRQHGPSQLNAMTLLARASSAAAAGETDI